MLAVVPSPEGAVSVSVVTLMVGVGVRVMITMTAKLSGRGMNGRGTWPCNRLDSSSSNKNSSQISSSSKSSSARSGKFEIRQSVKRYAGYGEGLIGNYAVAVTAAVVVTVTVRGNCKW